MSVRSLRIESSRRLRSKSPKRKIKIGDINTLCNTAEGPRSKEPYHDT